MRCPCGVVVHPMRIAKESTVESRATLLKDDPELERTLIHGVKLPLDALRASLEGLVTELDRESQGRSMIPAVLGEIDRLGRSVRDLIDYSAPPHPRPLRCTLAEIIASARHGIPDEQRRSISLACHDMNSSMNVDGPIVSRCVRRLIENALEAGSPQVLVVSRREENGATFSVVDDAPSLLDEERAREPFHSTKSSHLGLGLHLVERDLELLGGRLELSVSPHGTTRAEIRLPEATEALAR